jgi:hypothetical protein
MRLLVAKPLNPRTLKRRLTHEMLDLGLWIPCDQNPLVGNPKILAISKHRTAGIHTRWGIPQNQKDR